MRERLIYVSPLVIGMNMGVIEDKAFHHIEDDDEDDDNFLEEFLEDGEED